jgi:hypothetical protein
MLFGYNSNTWWTAQKYRKMSSNEQITPLNVAAQLYLFYSKAMSMP